MPLADFDIHLFTEGTHSQLYDKLGAHYLTSNEESGTHFAVWAPNAASVALMGDFNGWNKQQTMLTPHAQSGIWQLFVPGMGPGSCYKYHIVSQHGGYTVDKADPFAFHCQTPPQTASLVCDLDYDWGDEQWMGERGPKGGLDAPMSIYELHLGSWMRLPEQQNRSLSYREIAPKLAEHVLRLGFTHVEFMPLMEHPFYGSWGYQVTGYYAPTSRYGAPQDLMYLIDYLHQQGIGVILDWVPAHFPSDEHGLGYFDGTHLYEHADPRQGHHPDWKTLIFNYGRNEVRSFLLSSARFWLDRYHIDGLRVDGVASMLYLDYSRKAGEWIPNKHGGNENLEAVSLLRQFNQQVYEHHPDVQTIAEESTSWPMVSRPTYVGGLGFGLKWDMGWMHDTLRYFGRDPRWRQHHHGQLTFRAVYAAHENFVLALSHDEVVHGKGSLLQKMPGDDWQRFANLRLLYAYMFAVPGKKLLFMGSEFGQRGEWNHDAALEWQLRSEPDHAALEQLLGHLNRTYRGTPALHQWDCDARGFEWIQAHDSEQSVLSFLRRGSDPEEVVAVVFNFTPTPRTNYRIGVGKTGFWQEIANTDAKEFGGSGQGNLGGLQATPLPIHGRPCSLNLTLPPLGAIFLRGPG